MGNKKSTAKKRSRKQINSAMSGLRNYIKAKAIAMISEQSGSLATSATTSAPISSLNKYKMKTVICSSKECAIQTAINPSKECAIQTDASSVQEHKEFGVQATPPERDCEDEINISKEFIQRTLNYNHDTKLDQIVGQRLVDVAYFIRRIRQMEAHRCTNRSGRTRMTLVMEESNGFASIFTFRCTSCKNYDYLSTVKDPQSYNLKLASNPRGQKFIKDMLETLEMPVPETYQWKGDNVAWMEEGTSNNLVCSFCGLADSQGTNHQQCPRKLYLKEPSSRSKRLQEQRLLKETKKSSNCKTPFDPGYEPLLRPGCASTCLQCNKPSADLRFCSFCKKKMCKRSCVTIVDQKLFDADLENSPCPRVPSPFQATTKENKDNCHQLGSSSPKHVEVTNIVVEPVIPFDYLEMELGSQEDAEGVMNNASEETLVVEGTIETLGTSKSNSHCSSPSKKKPGKKKPKSAEKVAKEEALKKKRELLQKQRDQRNAEKKAQIRASDILGFSIDPVAKDLPLPMEYVPKLIPGRMVLCPMCNHIGPDFNLCKHCKEKIPPKSKIVLVHSKVKQENIPKPVPKKETHKRNRYCCVIGCHNTAHGNPEKSWLNFPKEPNIRQAWINRITFARRHAKDSPCNRGYPRNLNNYTKICGDHFNKSGIRRADDVLPKYFPGGVEFKSNRSLRSLQLRISKKVSSKTKQKESNSNPGSVSQEAEPKSMENVVGDTKKLPKESMEVTDPNSLPKESLQVKDPHKVKV